MEPSYLTEAMRRVTLSRKHAVKRLGTETASAFHALVRDLEAAANFSEVPVEPLRVSESNRVLLTFSLNGPLLLEIEPRTRHETSLQEWRQSHRFCLRRILDDTQVII